MNTSSSSNAHAAAHRAMALAVLRGKSSLPVRLSGYNHHRAIQRAIESQSDAGSWLEKPDSDAWADACEEIAAGQKSQLVRALEVSQ
jgi:hypothetical protein